MTRTRKRTRTGLGIALLCIVAPALGVVAVVAGVAPAAAAVQSVTPASATVTPGGAANATVNVDAAAVVCLEVSQPHPTVSASVDKACDAGTWSTGLRVRSSGDTPPGSYTVSVSDGESSRTFTLRVQAPPPSTTTTVRPTTTAPRATTTAPPPSTTPPTAPPTTAAPTTAPAPTAPPTTAPLGPGELRGEPFAPADVLVDAGIPSDGIFIPLTYEAFTDCLPLKGPCADLSSPLVLVPARAYDIRWSAAEGARAGALQPLLATRGLESLQVVGAEPGGAAAATFSLAVLDLAAGTTGDARSFESHLDGQRRLVPGEGSGGDGGSALSATLEPPVTAIDRSTSKPPFGRPYRMSTGRLTEAAPVLVAYGSAEPRLLYALRTPEEWGLGQQSLPLLGSGRVPYLARNVSGPPGLVVPIPSAIAGQLGPERTPAAADDDADGTGETAGSGGAKSSDGPLVFAAALVAAALAFFVLRFWRGRRRAAGPW